MTFLDAGRTSGENDPLGLKLLDLFQGKIVGMDLAVNVCLTDAPSYELGVLRAEVKNENHSAL